MTPLHVKSSKISNEKIPVPCGKCPNCIKRRTSGWSFRLVKQAEISKNPLFVTLTYDTEYVPITEKGYKSLSKTDIQKFIKRVRKNSKQKNIKYYCAGEYGSSERMRPHYHLIIYNTDELQIIRGWKINDNPIGHVHIGRVSDASIGYTLKYMSKQGKVPLHKNDDRLPEFQLMSKGLGKNYLTESMVKWHKDDLLNRMYIPLKGGKKAAMPRYYKDKIYVESEKNRIGRHIAQITEDETDVQMAELGDNYFHIIAQRTIAQFRKMYKKSKENEKL